MWSRLLAVVACAASLLTAPAAGVTQSITVDGRELPVTSVDVRGTRSLGGNDRGPALAVLADGTLLLGGGPRGGSIWAWTDDSAAPLLLGNVMTTKERLRDSRFAITDIAVLAQSETTVELLASFPRLTAAKCVEVVVYRVVWNRQRGTLAKGERWFRSTPCVPVSAVQHAAGRMEVIDASSAYVTIGDLGYSRINDRKRRGTLGSIHRITATSSTRISSGHRNPQGIVRTRDGLLLASEHGPQGGDEINVIVKGNDYGWPFVTLGEPYSPGDYVVPRRTGTHAGYPAPIIHWVPSIAPTELVELPATGFGRFNGGLVMGTLREESLVFMVREGRRITAQRKVPIGARIRDLERLPDDRLVATTDDGRLLFIG